MKKGTELRLLLYGIIQLIKSKYVIIPIVFWSLLIIPNYFYKYLYTPEINYTTLQENQIVKLNEETEYSYRDFSLYDKTIEELPISKSLVTTENICTYSNKPGNYLISTPDFTKTLISTFKVCLTLEDNITMKFISLKGNSVLFRETDSNLYMIVK